MSADNPQPGDPGFVGPTQPSSGSGAQSLAALATLSPLIVNMIRGSSQPNPGALLGTIPGGQDLLNGIVGQQQQQAPLRQAVTQQAMNMLPNSAFPGGRPTLSPVGAGPGPVSSGGGGLSSLLTGGTIGAGLGAVLLALSKTGVLKNLIPHFGGPTSGGSSGSNPQPGEPGFVGSVQPGTDPSNVGGPGDLSNIDPNGQVAVGSDAIQRWLAAGGGIPQGAREPGDQQGSSANTVGYF